VIEVEVEVEGERRGAEGDAGAEGDISGEWPGDGLLLHGVGAGIDVCDAGVAECHCCAGVGATIGEAERDGFEGAHVAGEFYGNRGIHDGDRAFATVKRYGFDGGGES